MNSDPEKTERERASFSAMVAKWTPIVLVVIFALYALSKLRPPRHEGNFDLITFGGLPVQEKGRVKPLDTVARNALLVMRGKQTVPDGPDVGYFEKLFYGKKSPRYLPAIEWFAELTLRPQQADGYKVFRIDHPEVLGLFGFEPGKEKYFSFNDLFHAGEIQSLRGEMDEILQEVNDFVANNPEATEKDRDEMRERLVPLYEETQKEHDALLARVTEVERATRSIKLGEDLNRNNKLDDGEDLNQNNKLDPGPDPKKYTPYQRNLGHLYESVTLYDQLKNAFYPQARAELFGPSYSNDLAVLALRRELLELGALENESMAIEALRDKPGALKQIQDFQASETFLQSQARFAPLGILPPASFEGTVSIENGSNKLVASNGSLTNFLSTQDQVKIGSYSTFRGIWRENQLREKLIKSVEGDDSATLTNVHEGRYWVIDVCFYLAFGLIAYGFFRRLEKKRSLGLAGLAAVCIFAGLTCVWQVLFGVPSATTENVTLHDIDWISLPDSLLETRGQSAKGDPGKTGKIDPIVKSYADLSKTFQEGDHAKFNGIVKKLSDDFAKVAPLQWHDFKNLPPEQNFNAAQPFVTCMALYLVALILVFFSWLIWQDPLQKSAVGIAYVALFIHIAGLLVRIWIQGRPPVTNLYSSAIFISLGAVIFGLMFERIYRNGIGTAAASIVGFVSLIIAHNLAMDGDTMEMLQAVLDTNLWLATHVVCITMGYVAMFVAGILGILYVLRGVLDRRFDKKTASSISSMIYGVTCFAVIFSFVGTMLGGIWADQSWGRFWGWDPKENGALLIVIWSAIALHSRWGGLAKDRGIAALAIGGNIVTAWSWFGTNLLQEGLHSYGFSDSGFLWLMRFIGLQLFFVAIAYLSKRLWRSELRSDAKTT